jgi:predicted restriction endonuclease
MAEAITIAELYDANVELAGLTEEEFERYGDFARRDESASIMTRPHLAKIRKLDRSIGEDLKTLYDFRCQICGENFGKPYEQRVVEVHHIDQFVRSMNNDYDNLMVICPNHHTVIHKAEPVFDRQSLALSYPNGYREVLRLDRHFNAGLN